VGNRRTGSDGPWATRLSRIGGPALLELGDELRDFPGPGVGSLGLADAKKNGVAVPAIQIGEDG
jgi:hypothetical protein